MILFNDDVKTLDASSYLLNLAVKGLDVFKFSKEKLVKTDSVNFNDAFLYRPNTFEGNSVVLEFTVRNIKLDEIMSKLFSSNKIVLSKDRNFFRYYFIDGEIEIKVFDEFTNVKVPLYLKAFRYFIDRDYKSINNTVVNVVNNLGNVYCEPIYKIYGDGEVIFSVNGERNILNNCSDVFVVDCFDKNVRDGNGNLKNISSDYNGVFSKLIPGENRVQLIKGNRLEIISNWRNR